ncbi:MogA/MoaB family molybdenum cofactor biosynthesis protein [Pantanalinema rosaneae CENA516]|uniref:MogA/MoaB family molybdenum cofactor biosynthesis protein n=1 Tax=Pantanalinema rosaneae TaxID=1620701 RepID=UPI003D6F5923
MKFYYLFIILDVLMDHLPHPTSPEITIVCAVITVSDTRTPETDRSGATIQQLLQTAGHQIGVYRLVKDEPEQIQMQLTQLSQQPELDACIFNGGTGIAPRDTTYDAIAGCLEKTLPGFGELFRWLSYQEIGSRAIASRAIAGVFQQKLVFSLPGSTNAVMLAMEKLILPELRHLVSQLRQ